MCNLFWLWLIFVYFFPVTKQLSLQNSTCAVFVCAVKFGLYSETFSECADVKQSGDKNQDVVLLIPNCSLMERFFVSGGKDPLFFYKKIMETTYPSQTKKWNNIIEELILEAELTKQNDEWQEESKGLFVLKKENM